MKSAIVSRLRWLLDRLAPPVPVISPKEEAWDAVAPILRAVTGMAEEASPAAMANALVLRLDRLTAEYEHLAAKCGDLRALIEGGQPCYARLILREYTLHGPLWTLLAQRGLLDPEHVSTPMGLQEVEIHLEGQMASSWSEWRH